MNVSMSKLFHLEYRLSSPIKLIFTARFRAISIQLAIQESSSTRPPFTFLIIRLVCKSASQKMTRLRN